VLSTGVLQQPVFEGENMSDIRLQIDFSETAFRALKVLQGRLAAESVAEVIETALGAYWWLADEVVNKRHAILLEKPTEGIINEVRFHCLDGATKLPAADEHHVDDKRRELVRQRGQRLKGPSPA
jgi:hypothetical protein